MGIQYHWSPEHAISIYMHFSGAGEAFIYTSPAPEKYLYTLVTVHVYNAYNNSLVTGALAEGDAIVNYKSSEVCGRM